MIGQTRMESLKEGAQNIALGMGLNAAASWTGIHLSNWMGAPWLDVKTPAGFGVFVGFMTVISMVRSYTIRRLNERKKFRDLPPEDWEAIARFTAERIRHVRIEGFDARHDDHHVAGELALGAAAYAVAAAAQPDGTLERAVAIWPWEKAWFKPSHRERNCEKAGAMLVAQLASMIRTDRRAAR